MRPFEHPRGGSPRSPEAPARARRSWRCTARPTSCIPIAAGSSPAGSWSWGRLPPTRHTSSGSCPRWVRTQWHCDHLATWSRGSPPSGSTLRRSPRWRARW